MKPDLTPKKFIFNDEIDSQFLYNMYEDDYPYIEEVFRTTLNHFEEDVMQVKAAYYSDDLIEMRKAVHKIKPVFGFTGLLHQQELICNFEKESFKASTVAELQLMYESMMSTIYLGKEIIESESDRLNDYNRIHYAN